MNLKIGDIAQVLDDQIVGKVLEFDDFSVKILTKDGFEMSFEPHKLIPFVPFEVGEISHRIINEKEEKKSIKTVTNRQKSKSNFVIEFDLHIEHLTANRQHLSNYEKLNIQLDTAKRKLEWAIQTRKQRIVFIHGVGEGVLKAELETLFRRYEGIKYYDADYKVYGLGATEVYIMQRK